MQSWKHMLAINDHECVENIKVFIVGIIYNGNMGTLMDDPKKCGCSVLASCSVASPTLSPELSGESSSVGLDI